MKVTPAKENLTAYYERLAAAYAALDEVKTGVEHALDAVEETKDVARSLYDPSTAASIFNGALRDLDLAARAIGDTIDGLPAIDEGREEGSASEENL